MQEQFQNVQIAPDKKFENPNEELEFLRRRIEEISSRVENSGEVPDRDKISRESVKHYAQHKPEDVYVPERTITPEEIEGIVLNLPPEEHDDQMAELINVIKEKGISNAIAVAREMGNAHIEDDLHRFLVEYIKEGLPVKDLKERDPLWRSLRMTLYEILLPDSRKDENQKSLKELVSAMDQFYAGMLSVEDEKKRNYFTIEMAVEHVGEDVAFYAAIPDEKTSIFEKQILSIFPNARIRVHKDDYNIFNPEGSASMAEASLEENPIFPLKTYEEFDYDPLNAILNSFSKLEAEGEGAAIQFVYKPVGDRYVNVYKKALEKIKEGKPIKEALSFADGIGDELKKALKEMFAGGGDSKKDESPKPVDQKAVERIEKKINSAILSVNVRLVASAGSKERSDSILHDIKSSFHQFEEPASNGLKFKELSGKKLVSGIKEYSFRMYQKKSAMPLSVKELTTIIHLPGAGIKESSGLRKSKAGSAPAPIGMPGSGILLGENEYRNHIQKIYFAPEDRMRHFYVIGQTGTGKTSLLKNMIVQDIKNGDGVCMIDPHGSDLNDIMAQIPPERFDDVIYFDPSQLDRPMGLNMLEYDPRFPEQKTFVVNELLSIFNKLFDMKTAGGPMFEQYFRQATMLVLEDPASGATLLDISRVLADEDFRKLKLSRSKNPIVNQFWTEIAQKAGGEASLQNIVPYITSKFDGFLGNDYMRPIIAQEKSSFNFREIMDQKKILLVNLSKGRLGDINSHLLGLILVGKILMAALSRVDSFGKDLPPFYLYIDEFQNITTDSISTILSEARKYKLSLNVAHQFIAQLEEGIKDSVFGNVGSMAVYRVGTEDAEFLERQFEPTFTANDIANIDNFNFYARLLVGGDPKKPFNVRAMRPEKGDPEQVEKLKQLSYQKYGTPREEVENEILARYKPKEEKPKSPFEF